MTMNLPESLRNEFDLVQDLNGGKILECYHVWDKSAKNDRVIRLLPSQFGEDVLIGDRFSKFFMKYASIAQCCIPRAIGLKKLGATFYSVEEFAPGIPITKVEFTRLDTIQKVKIFREICEALHHAHTKGVFHLCISPSDILVSDDDKVSLVGFGTAVFSGTEYVQRVGDENKELVAPEVLERMAAGPASDVFSLAACIAKVFPFLGSLELMKKALDRDPLDRFQKILEFQQVLGEIFPTSHGKEGGQTPPPRPQYVDLATIPPGAKILNANTHKVYGFTAAERGVTVQWEPELRILVEKDGYLRHRAKLTATRPSNKIEKTFELKPVTASITSTPTRALVTDRNSGERLAMTSESSVTLVQYNPARDIWIDKDGYHSVRLDWAGRVQDFTQHLDLSASVVSLRIHTDPDGVKVEVDGRFEGLTNSTGLAINVPHGKIELTLSKVGFSTETLIQNVDDGSVAAIGPIKLTPLPLQLYTDPPGAQVSLGSSVLGTTGPDGLSVPWHQGPITIKNDGYQTIVREFPATLPGLQVNVTLVRSIQEPIHHRRSMLWRGAATLFHGIGTLTISIRMLLRWMYPSVYQPERKDVFCNTNWGIARDDIPKDEAKHKKLVLFKNRWVTKQERYLLRKQLSTYRLIRAVALALYLPGLITLSFWISAMPDYIGYAGGSVSFVAIIFTGTRLWRFERWAMVVSRILWTLLFVPVIIVLLVDGHVLPLVMLVALWLALVWGAFGTAAARQIFNEPASQARS
ncbi:MAG: PEGA domain-containing protein [Desulfomonile tiedjei]|uniref:PEGA domain-containing protein n=1 Tax=Desulfomonile tiedjei TaxID=2358 RepID=A0A9D6Z5Q7_9BACT|nr:PEGA domain-containing protein [Desulfomonile tiedjei]